MPSRTYSRGAAADEVYENEREVGMLSQDNEYGADARASEGLRHCHERARTGPKALPREASAVLRCCHENASMGPRRCMEMASVGPGLYHESVGEGIGNCNGRTQGE